MKWKKRGLIFDPAQFDLGLGHVGFAQSPQTLIKDDRLRIYFSTRQKDNRTGKFLSQIAYADFDQDFSIIDTSRHTVIELGELGCFDEHGIFPINLLQHNGRDLAYTCGWSRRISVSVETSTGIAESFDKGRTFIKIGPGPILTSSLKEPMLVGDSFVRFFDGTYHMWYIFGERWIKPDGAEVPERIYKIGHALSDNGVDWKKEEGLPIIPDVIDEHECQALPTVIKIGKRYHMYFCFRHAIGFRTEPQKSYRIGYAWSDDLKNWTRDDTAGGLTLSKEGWDSEMMCYPHLFEWLGKQYILYNGNQFGKNGFGLAELESI